MDIQVLASGSRGNCYRVTDGKTALLLECGIPFPQILKSLDYRTSEIEACLLTHEHGDHARAAKDLLRAGVDVYTSAGTARALGFKSHRLRVVQPKTRFTVGSWSILPFDTVHDAAEPLGFLLDSGEERLLFATDTAYLRYRFTKLTHIMLECNYDLEILKANVAAGLVSSEVKRRVLKSHMSLETAKNMLKANDLRRVREIILIHLSDDNGNAQRFKNEIARITGKVVRIA